MKDKVLNAVPGTVRAGCTKSNGRCQAEGMRSGTLGRRGLMRVRARPGSGLKDSSCIASGGSGRDICCFISVQNLYCGFSVPESHALWCVQGCTHVPRAPWSQGQAALWALPSLPPPEQSSLPPSLPSFVHSHNRLAF